MSRTKPARYKAKHPTFANRRREFACDDDLMSFNSTEAPRIVGPRRTDDLDKLMDKRWSRVGFDMYESHIAYLLSVMNLPNSNHLPNPLPPDMVALIRAMEEGDNRE